MSAKEFITFIIPCEIYRTSIGFCITKNTKKAAKYIGTAIEDNTITEEDFLCLGKCFTKEGLCPIIWLPAKPKTPEEIGTAVHEIFHAFCDTLEWTHMRLAPASEEPFAHFIGYLVREFFKRLPK